MAPRRQQSPRQDSADPTPEGGVTGPAGEATPGVTLDGTPDGGATPFATPLTSLAADSLLGTAPRTGPAPPGSSSSLASLRHAVHNLDTAVTEQVRGGVCQGTRPVGTVRCSHSRCVCPRIAARPLCSSPPLLQRHRLEIHHAKWDTQRAASVAQVRGREGVTSTHWATGPSRQHPQTGSPLYFV
jgi:hypothetical protein